MIQTVVQAVLCLIPIVVVAHPAAGATDGWTSAVEVRHDASRCVSYRARWSGSHLIVEAMLEPGWHTFAMDNDRRATEKLAGKRSLGIERPTEIRVSGGLEAAGPWLQTPPKDASKPELNWFTWIFEERAVFAAQVRRSAGDEARVAVRGQVCTDSSCVNVDVEIPLALHPGSAPANASTIDLDGLVPVKEK